MVRLNLRMKLIIGFVVFVLCTSWINFAFLRDFDSFQKNVQMLSHASNLSNLCLEIRRYEKNFIIKKDIDDYNIASNFITKLLEYLDDIKSDIDLDDYNSLEKLKSEVIHYQNNFIPLKDKCLSLSESNGCNQLELLQKLGANIVTLAEGLFKTSEVKIDKFSRDSKIKLSLYNAFLVAFSLGGLLVYHVTIAKRLKFLENAANNIAKGNYSDVPVSKSNDEVQSVLVAFEHMVVDLEERQEQLFQAEKLSSIGTLASGMAHQLNNPLNNIATSCQIALEEAKEAEEDKSESFLQLQLNTIYEETLRAAEIVRGLLEFSRSENFTCKLTSIKDVIKKAISLITSELPSGITITQDIPEDLVAKIDVQKIKEVFVNLLINSIHAIKEHTGTINITAQINSDTNMIEISVSDTGEGIDEANRQCIFDPFYTTKEVGEGTGLGLAVVYGIIKKHKGAISVKSNNGKGSTFIISLPHT